MLIPSDTAKPLNSFLNWGLTLKLSDSFSLSGALFSLVLSVRLLAKAHPHGAATTVPVAQRSTRIQISAFLAIPKGRNRSIPKARNEEFWIGRSTHAFSIVNHSRLLFSTSRDTVRSLIWTLLTVSAVGDPATKRWIAARSRWGARTAQCAAWDGIEPDFSVSVLEQIENTPQAR